MPYYCTVPRCTSMAGKAKNVSFHQFPRDEELAKLWNKILKRGKPYTKYSKVCSLHFTAEDYTITSVGKNKGQWRTLRKDAIPSQNLPSESPTPYQRKQWSSWTRDPPSNIMDPTIHQQVAQAIYMQTMLAMQAAGAPDMSSLNHSNGLPPIPSEAFAHTSATPDTDILKGKQTNTHAKTNSFKCTECSKCFKDPDVFILHKRSHIKNEKNEKENFNLNLTLQANPILANLLKTNTESSNIFDTNFSMESLLMTALAANMEGYMRNFTSMIKNEERGHEHRRSQSLERDDNNLYNDRGQFGHDNGQPGHDSGQLGHDSGQLSHDNGHLRHESGHVGRDRSSYDKNNDRRGFQDCQSTSQSVLNNDITTLLKRSNHIESDRDMNDRGMNSDRNIFSDRIIEHFRNNTYDSNRSVRYHENGQNDSESTKSDGDFDQNIGRGSDASNDDDHMIDGDDKGFNDYNGPSDCSRRVIGHDKDMMKSDRDLDDTYNSGSVPNDDDDSQGSSDEPFCDNDLNESIDSNKLVIDESV